ncbi:FkbM family methyltransferase [Azospirillum argentinense]|uniref:FkbM family methyltransferase n=1 Tax=Azospirillum brasilense TaxID=192 RepID=A0A4D8Q5S9_AZOBR|nr:FkbM family methyltransferase [Azospirillum argentinense]QCO04611.1 FkbM family methyltransferase [Azospirillum argentinense]
MRASMVTATRRNPFRIIDIFQNWRKKRASDCLVLRQRDNQVLAVAARGTPLQFQENRVPFQPSSFSDLEPLRRSFQTIVDRLAPDIAGHPRRTGGSLDVGGRELRYIDLHSVYWQSRQIFIDRLYDLDIPSRSPVILDCGAHIGLATLFFANRFPTAQVHAFEADPTIADALAFNVGSFGLSRVTVHRQAVWVNEGTIRFSATGDDSGSLLPDGDTGTLVSTMRLRDFIEGHEVDLLKLDIEGSEFAVLADCEGALKNVRALIAEVHLFGQRDASLANLLTVIERSGFRYTLSDLHQPVWLPCPARPPFRQLHTSLGLVTVFAWR